MNRKEIMQKARFAQRPKLVYEDDAYSINLIPLNYKIWIKLPKKPNCLTINRDFYTSPEHGLGYAHSVALEVIKDYFIDDMQSKVNKKS